MINSLLPCPFCGGRPTVDFPLDGYPEILCRNCYQAGTTLTNSTVAEAIAAWNTRIERTCHAINTNIRMVSNVPLPYVRFDCCGFETIETYTMSYCPNCGAKVVSQMEKELPFYTHDEIVEEMRAINDEWAQACAHASRRWSDD